MTLVEDSRERNRRLARERYRRIASDPELHAKMLEERREWYAANREKEVERKRRERTQAPQIDAERHARELERRRERYAANREKEVKRKRRFRALHPGHEAELRKRHYEKHREKILARRKTYRQAHLEQEAAHHRAYYLAHREHQLEMVREWRRKHPEAQHLYTMRSARKNRERRKAEADDAKAAAAFFQSLAIASAINSAQPEQLERRAAELTEERMAREEQRKVRVKAWKKEWQKRNPEKQRLYKQRWKEKLLAAPERLAAYREHERERDRRRNRNNSKPQTIDQTPQGE